MQIPFFAIKKMKYTKITFSKNPVFAHTTYEENSCVQ